MSYVLNKDAKVRKGGRVIAKLTEDEFIEKMKDFCKKYPDAFGADMGDDEILEKIVAVIGCLGTNGFYTHTQIHKDFKGLEVDLENQDPDGDIRLTPSGCPYLVGWAGGDWETPVCYIIYYDGKEIRAYVPKRGNTWRTLSDGGKVALGNNNPGNKFDDPVDDYKWVHKDLTRTKQISKSVKPKDINLNDIEYDLDLCIEEFLERVGEI